MRGPAAQNNRVNNLQSTDSSVEDLHRIGGGSDPGRVIMTGEKILPRKKWEYLIPALAILSLLVSCVVVSAKKYFWNDELLSYYLFSDRSFLHMLEALHDKINNAPPLYFVLGWMWARVGGTSELSLRLLSCVGMCTGLWFVWITLRRSHGLWSTSVATFTVFCTSQLILYLNAEVRMYGLFMGFAGLAMFFHDVVCRKVELTSKWILAMFATHAALINTHLFGILYSGASLLALVARDRWFRTFRPKVYAIIVLSWLTLLPYVPSFLNQADAGKPRGWLPKPILHDLIEFLGVSTPTLFDPMFVSALIIIAGLQFLLLSTDVLGSNQNGRAGRGQARDSRISLLILSLAFLGILVAVWVFSVVAKSIFYQKYMLPTALSWSVLFALVASHLRLDTSDAAATNTFGGTSISMRLKATVLPLALVLALLGKPLIYARGFEREPRPGCDDNQFGYADLAIVVQPSHSFLSRLQYSPERDRYFFILDWEAAVSEESGLFGPQEYKELEAVGRQYPALGKHIVQGADFLAAHQRFLVLDYEEFNKPCSCNVRGSGTDFRALHCPQWVEKRLLHNPQYSVKPLGHLDKEGCVMLLVEHH
jgi:hypothetical protein